MNWAKLAWAKLAWAGSVFLILSALYFQYFQSLDPCVLCIYQRYPHYIAMGLGALLIAFNRTQWSWVLSLILLCGVGIAIFHVGVEQAWWEGLKNCSGEIGLSADDLLAKPAARCDEIPWSFLGLSMAAWNGILSFVLALFWLQAARTRQIG